MVTVVHLPAELIESIVAALPYTPAGGGKIIKQSGVRYIS
jgi:hypothetical protein